MNEEPPLKRRLLSTCDNNDTTENFFVSSTSAGSCLQKEDQLLERPFDVIPEEIITGKLFLLLLPASYASLHLVCWRWRRLLIRDAHILPKLKFSGSRSISFKNSQCTAWKNNRSMVKSCNVDGTGSGAHLLDLLRHVQLGEQGVQFGDNYYVTGVLLTQLVTVISLRPSAITFFGCDFTSITENDLLSFLTAMAEYGTCSELAIQLYSNDLLNPGVVTDRSLEPIIGSGSLKSLILGLPGLNFDCDSNAEGNANDYAGVSDEMLVKFSSNYPPHFEIHIHSGCKITAQGIWNFVLAFKESATSNSGCINCMASLGNDFRKFCYKNGHTSCDQQITWSFENWRTARLETFSSGSAEKRMQQIE